MDYSIISALRDLMFNSPLKTLTQLQLSSDQGLILDKQLHPNVHLTNLTISLQQVADLLILLDGLVPKLIFLNVTICQTDLFSTPTSMARSRSIQSMPSLVEFRLTTDRSVDMTLEYLHEIVTLLNRLKKLTLNIKQCIHENQIIHGDQRDISIHQFVPCLQDFRCRIRSLGSIDKRIFAAKNERWAMASRTSRSGRSQNLYTVPWSFPKLGTSMLADDDTNSTCPDVEELAIIGRPTNLARRFPNIHTLDISPDGKVSPDDYVQLRRVYHLIAEDISIIPSLMNPRITVLSLNSTKYLLKHSTIYSQVQHLDLSAAEFMSYDMITTVVRLFPKLQSLTYQLESTPEYYDCLHILLDGEHLPDLTRLKLSWINQGTEYFNINLWLLAHTPVRWRSIPFLGHCHNNWLTICL